MTKDETNHMPRGHAAEQAQAPGWHDEPWVADEVGQRLHHHRPQRSDEDNGDYNSPENVVFDD